MAKSNLFLKYLLNKSAGETLRGAVPLGRRDLPEKLLLSLFFACHKGAPQTRYSSLSGSLFMYRRTGLEQKRFFCAALVLHAYWRSSRVPYVPCCLLLPSSTGIRSPNISIHGVLFSSSPWFRHSTTCMRRRSMRLTFQAKWFRKFVVLLRCQLTFVACWIWVC